MAFKVPEKYRVRNLSMLASSEKDGNNGCFQVPAEGGGRSFTVIASDGMGWEHVSVSISNNRTPRWEEMCFIKDMFWDEEDCVVQYHPPKADYVNNHAFVLHLWRPTGAQMQVPRPPSILVGLKSQNL